MPAVLFNSCVCFGAERSLLAALPGSSFRASFPSRDKKKVSPEGAADDKGKTEEG